MSAGRNEKVTPGKRTGGAQLVHIFGGRAVPGLQRDLHVTVLLADCAGVVIGKVDSADGHTDIVRQRAQVTRRNDRADRVLNLAKLAGAVLDTRADLEPDVHEDLS